MNENLQQALSDLITTALSSAKTATEFLVAEVPDVVYQLLLWHGIRSFVLFLVGCATLAMFVTYCVWAIKSTLRKEKDAFMSDSAFFKFAGGIALGFLTAIFTSFTLNLTWLQILIAPKVWLLEYAARLVR